jgi:hypothetical protein
VVRLTAAFLVGLTLQLAVNHDQAPVNHDAAVLADFKARVDKYVELRNKADDSAKPMKSTSEASDIRTSQLEQAERIGVARKDAKPGDIFTPDVAVIIKRLLRPEVKEPGTKAAAKDEEDLPTRITFKINDQYPPKEPLATFPPNLLAALPPLPKDVEYRLVGRHLILRDVTANLIVDYIVNAMPKG